MKIPVAPAALALFGALLFPAPAAPGAATTTPEEVEKALEDLNAKGARANQKMEALLKGARANGGDEKIIRLFQETVATAFEREEDRREATRKFLDTNQTAYAAIFNKDKGPGKGLRIARLFEESRACFGGDGPGWFSKTAEVYLSILRNNEKNAEALEGIRGLLGKHREIVEELKGGAPKEEPKKEEEKSTGFTAKPTEEKAGGKVKLYKVGDLHIDLWQAFAAPQIRRHPKDEDKEFRIRREGEEGYVFQEEPPAGGAGIEELWLKRVVADSNYYIETRGPHGVVHQAIYHHYWRRLEWDDELEVWTNPTRKRIRKFLAEMLDDLAGQRKVEEEKRGAVRKEGEEAGDSMDGRYREVEEALGDGETIKVQKALRALEQETDRLRSAGRSSAHLSTPIFRLDSGIDYQSRRFKEYGGSDEELAAILDAAKPRVTLKALRMEAANLDREVQSAEREIEGLKQTIRSREEFLKIRPSPETQKAIEEGRGKLADWEKELEAVTERRRKVEEPRAAEEEKAQARLKEVRDAGAAAEKEAADLKAGVDEAWNKYRDNGLPQEERDVQYWNWQEKTDQEKAAAGRAGKFRAEEKALVDQIEGRW